MKVVPMVAEKVVLLVAMTAAMTAEMLVVWSVVV